LSVLLDSLQEEYEVTDNELSLIKANVGLVMRIASCYLERDLQEVVLAGLIGLIKAIRMFDPQRGKAFSTIAFLKIRREIQDMVRHDDPISLSSNKIYLHAQIQHFIDDFLMQNGREPTNSEIAAHFNLRPYKLAFLLNSRRPEDIEKIEAGQAAVLRRSQKGPGDWLSPGEARLIEGEVLNDLAAGELRARLSKFLGEKDLLILEMLGVFGGPEMTQIEVANKLGVTKQAISFRLRQIGKNYPFLKTELVIV